MDKKNKWIKYKTLEFFGYRCPYCGGTIKRIEGMKTCLSCKKTLRRRTLTLFEVEILHIMLRAGLVFVGLEPKNGFHILTAGSIEFEIFLLALTAFIDFLLFIVGDLKKYIE